MTSNNNNNNGSGFKSQKQKFESISSRAKATFLSSSGGVTNGNGLSSNGYRGSSSSSTYRYGSGSGVVGVGMGMGPSLVLKPNQRGPFPHLSSGSSLTKDYRNQSSLCSTAPTNAFASGPSGMGRYGKPINSSSSFGGRLPVDDDKTTMEVVPVWEGYLNASLNATSSKAPVGLLLSHFREILETLVDKEQVDYEVAPETKYSFNGRMYSMNDCSDFKIDVYRLPEKDKQNNISVFEIRRINGDSFTHEEFRKQFLQECVDHKLIQEDLNPSIGSFGFLPRLTLDSLSMPESDVEMLDMDLDEDDEIDSTMSCDDGSMDRELCQDLLSSLYDRDSDRNVYMHSAVTLATFLKEEDKRCSNMINYIAKQEAEEIITKLITPITQQLYNTFILLHVLDIIYSLMTNKTLSEALKIPSHLKDTISNLQSQWSNESGVSRQLGQMNIHFARSQQVSRKCITIAKLF